MGGALNKLMSSHNKSQQLLSLCHGPKGGAVSSEGVGRGVTVECNVMLRLSESCFKSKKEKGSRGREWKSRRTEAATRTRQH